MTSRVVLLAGGAAAAALLVLSQTGIAQSGGAQNGGAQSGAQILAALPVDDDVVLKAMRDEMERSRQLRVAGGQDAPYFFSYDLTDAENFQVVATLGSPVSVSRRHVRQPGAEVRVGSYEFDNTGHVFSGRYSGSRYDGNWPMDDNYALLREGYWLLTDRMFKAAEESIGRKRASLKNTAATTEQIPDFSKADPVVSLPKVAHKKIDDAAWTQRIAKLSSVFGAYPEVLSLHRGASGHRRDYRSAQLRRHRHSLCGPGGLGDRAGGGPGSGRHAGARRCSRFNPWIWTNCRATRSCASKISDVAEHVRELVKAPVGESFTGPGAV